MRPPPPFRQVLPVLAAVAFTWLFTPASTAAFKNVGTGDRPPPFALKDLEEKEWKSADLLEGKVTVVVFWSTWSPRSREILADLEKLRAELGPERFQVVAVNAEHMEISSADRSSITAMAKELGLTSLILLDHGLVTYNDYGVMAVPSSLVVDGAGKVTYDLAGYPTTLRSDLADAVRKALGLPTSEELRPPEEYVPMNHALMYYNFGRRLMEKGQDEKAEAQLLVSVERDPEFVKPRILLGVYYKRSGRLEEALEQFRKVKELDPGHHEAGYQEAIVSLRAGRFEEAETLFGGLAEEFPAREEFALGLALAQKYQGKEQQYRTARERASTLVPAEARVHYEMGGVAESQQDLEEAAALYRLAIEGALAAKR